METFKSEEVNLFGVSVSTDWRFSFLCVIIGNLGHLFTSRSKFWLSNRMTGEKMKMEERECELEAL